MKLLKAIRQLVRDTLHRFVRRNTVEIALMRSDETGRGLEAFTVYDTAFVPSIGDELFFHMNGTSIKQAYDAKVSKVSWHVENGLIVAATVYYIPSNPTGQAADHKNVG